MGRQSKKNGVLITNLGTPDAPTAPALRRYLAEFLSDPRVVNRPRWFWLPILYGVILRIRPRRSAQAYQRVWTDEGSPLIVNALRQQAGILQYLPDDMPVVLAMRYGQPSIETGLKALRDQGVERIMVLPLYPQFSGSTTTSTFDAVVRVMQQWQDLPDLHMVMSYFDNEHYIQALADSVRDYWQQHGQGEYLLMSFHGTPQSMREAGDPYYNHCKVTADLLRQNLGLQDDRCLLTFQSRFGPEAWLQPYTDKTLEGLAQRGVKRVDVICPGFSADCLETLDEMAVENSELFIESGGQALHYIPALNDRDDHLQLLAGLIKQAVNTD